MGVTLEMTKAFLASADCPYEEVREGETLRLVVGNIDNKGSVEVLAHFDDNEKTVALSSYNLCSVPENKKKAVFKLCSELNKRFRWVKFYLDKDDNTITAEDDAIVSPESAGEEVLELTLRMAHIIGDVYPEIMKTIWA